MKPNALAAGRRRGFTLVELVAAISLTGALSATALPALVDLRTQADATLLDSLAAAAGSAMALNRAGCLVTGERPAAGRCVAVSDCSQVGQLLQLDLPAGFRVDAQPLAAGDGSARCTLRADTGASAPFAGLAAGR